MGGSNPNGLKMISQYLLRPPIYTYLLMKENDVYTLIDEHSLNIYRLFEN